jgi:LemA protein
VERYPDLKANKGFSDLRVQLEGTENRITVANRYIQTVQEYNVLAQLPEQPDGHGVQLQPQAQLHGRRTKPRFPRHPQVDFGKK